MRELLVLIFCSVLFASGVGAQEKQNAMSREEALKFARSINGRDIGEFWYEEGDKKGPYRHAGRVILRPRDHILYQGGGSGVMGMMPDQDSWETRMDFFIAESGASNVMVHIFKAEVEPTRPKPEEDKRPAAHKALSPAALHAIEGDDLELLKLLFEKGLKVNEVLDFEMKTTALYHAVLHRSPKMVKFLLSKGAEREKRRRFGDRPIDLAIKWDLKEIIQLLGKTEKDEALIDGVPVGVLDSIFQEYFTEEIMFLSWNEKDPPAGLLKFLRKRMPKVRSHTSMEVLKDRPLGAHSWYRDKKDKGFGSLLQVLVKKGEKGWEVTLRDTVAPSLSGHGWKVLVFKKHGYWVRKRVSSWGE